MLAQQLRIWCRGAGRLDGYCRWCQTWLSAPSPLAAKLTHRVATAKSVIFLFMEGGPSQMDTFDPKPALQQLAGKRIPDSYERIITAMGEFDSPVLASQRKWKQYGENGIWISDWLPNITRHADELAVIRSCWTNGINHSGGVCQMNTGSQFAGRPSLGSWVTYGLGTENQNLPVCGNARYQRCCGQWGSELECRFYACGVSGHTALRVDRAPFDNLASPKNVR
ncbi:MAG: DUF1501 domain-containing protein [Pirellulaceae bacterium]